MDKYIFPITFSIPKEKICTSPDLIKKTKILSDLIPGRLDTYIYNNETDYYNEYQKSLFALTTKKGGWDCLRHYEILANNCIPIFPNIENCPKNTMKLLSKTLIIEGNLLYEAFKNKYIHELSEEDLNKYNNLANRLFNYTNNNLTTKQIAKYILNKTNNDKCYNILYLSGDTNPDYLRCLTLHGFKELFGENCHDYPKIPHIYKSNNINYTKLYGKGISYTNLLDETLHNSKIDNNILDYIKIKHFDLIIYGSHTRGMPFYDLVDSIYEPNKIILLNGEDNSYNIDYFTNWILKGHYVFVRELE